MKLEWFLAVTAVVLAHALTWAQQPDNGLPALTYEDGRIENNIYANECFGFSLAIPDGWLVSDGGAGNEAKARHLPGGDLFLLALDQHGASKNHMVLKARVAIPSDMTAEEFVSNTVHAQIDVVDRQRRELVRDTYSVEYGGKRFFRADYKMTIKGSDVYMPLYQAFVYTKFREYFIGGVLIARSREGLDQSAASLENISFREDERNPKCGMRSEMRVRVSQGVSTGLLVTKVQPLYPDDARLARIQGSVVLQSRDRQERERRRTHAGFGASLACPSRP